MNKHDVNAHERQFMCSSALSQSDRLFILYRSDKVNTKEVF